VRKNRAWSFGARNSETDPWLILDQEKGKGKRRKGQKNGGGEIKTADFKLLLLAVQKPRTGKSKGKKNKKGKNLHKKQCPLQRGPHKSHGDSLGQRE